MAPAIRAAAGRPGVALAEIETNSRGFSDPLVGWSIFHDSAMASVALLLAPRFESVYVAATHHDGQLLPLGSHPDLDPLWSTESVRIVLDGTGGRRLRFLGRLTTRPA